MDAPKPISYTRISTYTYRCPYAYYLKYVKGLRPTKTSLNRVWGSALHSAIEQWHLSGKTTPLALMMDEEFKRRLTEIHEDFEPLMDTSYDLRRDWVSLLDELSKKYTAPTSSKAWKDADVVAKVRALRERTATLAESVAEQLQWPKREDAFARAALHAKTAAQYEQFDATYPLLTFDDGAPMVEENFEFALDGFDRPLMAIVDQGRLIPDASGTPVPMPVDLKSWSDPLNEALTDRYQQGLHYQLAWAFTPDRHPSPGGFAIYDLRTGAVTVQAAIDSARALAWANTCKMVLLAEEHGIFPPRDDNKCMDCDFWEVSCRDRTGLE